MKIGPFHFFTDLGFSIGDPNAWYRVGFYADLPWGDDHKAFDCPIRMHVHFGKLGSIVFGYPYYETVARDMFGENQKTGWKVDTVQRWSFKRGWHPPRKWSWITWTPGRDLLCRKEVGQLIPRSPSRSPVVQRLRASHPPKRMTCGRLRWHRGHCYGGIPTTWQLTDGGAYAYKLV